MQIQKLKLAQLEPNTGQIPGLPINPRQWTKGDVDKIAASLRETPELFEARPVLVVPHDGKYVILGGNLRYEGARANKEKEVPAIVFPEDTPIEKMKEIVIKDNGAFGAWDYDALANEWDDLPLGDWGVPAWETEDLPPVNATASEDDFDESKEVETRCKLGDIWRLGVHRLMCGDSTNEEDVALLMSGSKADLLLTDPPYNVDYEGATEEKMKIMNDAFSSDEEFLDFLQSAFSCAANNMRDGSSFYIFHGDSEGLNFRQATSRIGAVRECLIWVKNSLVMGRQDYQWRHEPCLYGWKEGAPHSWYSDRKQTTILEFDRPQKNKLHPTSKPVALFSYLMQNSSKSGDIILDLFGGSGTTIIAAEQIQRKAYLMELDPHYCDVIIARWENLTNQKAEKL